MTTIATCHCGGTRIELPEAPVHAMSCTCTYCTKVGGLWSYYPPDGPKIVSDTHGAVYSQSGFNQHHFCAKCGCQTYGISPDWSMDDIGANEMPKGTRFAVNARLLDDFDAGTLVVETIDGRNLW